MLATCLHFFNSNTDEKLLFRFATCPGALAKASEKVWSKCHGCVLSCQARFVRHGAGTTSTISLARGWSRKNQGFLEESCFTPWSTTGSWPWKGCRPVGVEPCLGNISPIWPRNCLFEKSCGANCPDAKRRLSSSLHWSWRAGFSQSHPSCFAGKGSPASSS